MGRLGVSCFLVIFGLSYFTDVVHGIYCLTCAGYQRSEDCATVKKCSPQEICHTEMVVYPGGIIKYNMGCKDKRRCSSDALIGKRSGFAVCSECCSGPNLCNGNLCNANGYPMNSTDNRGPICTKCDDQIRVDKCDIIEVCGRGQVCMVSYDIKRHIYSTGCEEESECEAIYQATQPVYSGGKKRALSDHSYIHNGVCMVKCCKDDLCNTECAPHNSSSSSQHSTLHSSATNLQSSTQSPIIFVTSSQLPTVTSPPLLGVTTLPVFTPAPTNFPAIPTKPITTTKTSSISGDPCHNSACVYGTCVAKASSYSCSCTLGAFGQYCDQHVDMCLFQPCHHGTCQRDTNAAGYTCTCDSGYSGTDCDIATG